MAELVSESNPSCEFVKVGEAGNGNVCSSGLTTEIRVTYKRRKSNKSATQFHHKEMVDFVSEANGSSGSDNKTDSLATYRRRKTNKFAENSTMHLFDEDSRRRSDDPKNNSSKKHPINIVLEQICHSLDNECGLTKCIKSTIALQPGTCAKESVHSCENGAVHKPNHGTVKELCQTTFSDIIKSEKFAQLCSLLLEHFPGMKADGIFDLNRISSRMKEKLYDNSPILFHSDMQQIWENIQKVGTDMIAFAKCLSDKTSTSFQASVSEDGAKHEEFDMLAKGEPTEACAVNEVHKCSHCSQKVEGRNFLVCDACEEMYHISCIVPAIIEIPSNSWYCANCTVKHVSSK